MFPRFLLALGLALASAAAGLGAGPALVVDPAASRITVAVRVTVDSFTAKLNRFDAAVAMADDGRVLSARVAFQFRDLVTGKDGRDQAMHKWQETDKFPDGTFELASLEPAATAGAFTATGKLTLHGVTRELKFPVTIVTDGPVRKIDGEAPVDTREFGLPVIRMALVLKVDPVVRVIFHLEGRPSS